MELMDFPIASLLLFFLWLSLLLVLKAGRNEYEHEETPLSLVVSQFWSRQFCCQWP